MSLKNDFGERLKLLYANDNNSEEIGIKEDTFNKYIRGERFPKPDILEKIKNHYKVPYSYLFGEYDNKDLETSEISGKLGLSNKSISKLSKIRFEKDIQDKNLMIYALNEIIENIDLLEFGKLLLIPNKDNKYIKSEEIYEYYSDYINHCQGENDYLYDLQNIKKEKEYSDFILNKRLFQMFENIRNSQECAKVFVDYVNRERKTMNDIDSYLKEDFMNADNYQPFVPDEELEKIMQEQHREMEERNKKIVDKRKKDLGL